MIDKDTIVIRNVYYMLAYAYQMLHEADYRKLASEDFAGAEDLFAAILSITVPQLLKQGLKRQYVDHADNITVVRGRISLADTIKNRLRGKNHLIYCEFDELSANNIYNSIIKSTIALLLRQKNISQVSRDNLKVLHGKMCYIREIDLRSVPWSTLERRTRSRLYDMLMNICYFVYRRLLISTKDDTREILDFADDKMEKVFEKFVYEYYRIEHGLSPSAMRIGWADDRGIESSYLPAMRTDVTLTHGDRTLIVDTKYYGKVTTEYYDREKVRSGHLYQIFAYVKNYDYRHTGKTNGVLLYAKTLEDTIPDLDFVTEGNHIAVRVLNLDQDFAGIRSELDSIADEFLYMGAQHE